MGWIIDLPGMYGHEGWPAFRTGDGRIWGSSNRDGVLRMLDDGTDEHVPWSEVVGWQVACECGWTGPTWDRSATLPGTYEGHDAEDAHLVNGSTVEDEAHAAWREHIKDIRLVSIERKARRAPAPVGAAERTQLATHISQRIRDWRRIVSDPDYDRNAEYDAAEDICGWTAALIRSTWPDAATQ
jgi:hypothetical protein